jgi:hypothetical protein
MLEAGQRQGFLLQPQQHLTHAVQLGELAAYSAEDDR